MVRLLGFIVCVVTVGLILNVGCRRGEGNGDVPREAGREALERVRAFNQHHYPPQKTCTQEVRDELQCRFAEACFCFTNGVAGSLDKLLPTMTDRVGKIRLSDYRSLVQEFETVVQRSFILSREEKAFADVREFDAFLGLNAEAVRFLGELELCQVERNLSASNLECLMLRRLYACRDHYRREGRENYVEVVQRYIGRWESQVESELGLSRRAARYRFALSQSRREEVGDLTLNQVVGSARVHAQGLVNIGYKPRWLDQEFPLPKD